MVTPKLTAETDIKNRYETPIGAGTSGSSGSGSYSAANLTGNENAEKCWNYFTKTWGISKTWAAAFLGNIVIESFDQIDPNAGGSIGVDHYGICQWDTDRQKYLVDLSGSAANTLEGQLPFIRWECENSGGTNIDRSEIGPYIKQNQDLDVDSATDYLIEKYENSGNQSRTERHEKANGFINLYGNK